MALAAQLFPEPDLMTELLLDMRLRGVQYRRIEITPPFGLSFGTEPGRAHFHFVAAGTVFLRDATGDVHAVSPGTAVLLPRRRRPSGALGRGPVGAGHR